MLPPLQLRWLSILAVLFALTQANWFDGNIFKRQGGVNSAVSGALSDVGITSGSSPSTSGSGAAGSTTPTTSPTSQSDSTSSVNSPTPTPPSTSSSPSVTSSPTSSPSSSTPDSSTTTSDSQSTTNGGSTTSHGSSTSSSQSVHITTEVTLITTDGSVYSSTTIASSTSGSTDAASQQKGVSSGSSGMSTSTRNAVIGACVGVGGAALLGALAFVFFRLRKSKRSQDESDGLMGFRTGVDSAHEKSSTPGAPNQFQSTLESYHAPPRNANVSSNF